jgi:hypothetical protein
VTDPQQSRHETDTEVIPPVSSGEGIASTQELPTVDDETVEALPAVHTAVRSASTASREPVSDAVGAPSAVQEAPVTLRAQAAPAVQEAPVTVVASSPPPPLPPLETSATSSTSTPPSPPAAPPAGGGEGARSWRTAFLALVAAVVIGVVAGLVVVHGRTGSGILGSGGGGSTAASISATVSSFDPSGGSGFRPQGAGTWRTQTYQSADYGNLKSGAGLLLDLGAPRAVGAVTFEVVGGPVAVELRAGDEHAGSEAAYTRVTGTSAASGTTTFALKGGAKHRYWLIWVTRLAPQDGGYRAVIRQPVVKGSAA